MLIDRGVDVLVAHPGLAVPVALSASVGAPASAGGDAAQLLDVHVDQVTRGVAFVADRSGRGGADQLTGHRVQRAQPRQVVAGQDP